MAMMSVDFLARLCRYWSLADTVLSAARRAVLNAEALASR